MTEKKTSESEQPKSKEGILVAAGIILILLLWIAWVATAILISALISLPSNQASEILGIAGTLGDLFGGINALFTGIGIVLLAFTIGQQGILLKQQQASIAQMETNLINQKDAFQREQALQSLLRIQETLQAQPVRAAREIVLSGQGQPNDLSDLTFVLIKEQAIEAQKMERCTHDDDVEGEINPNETDSESKSVLQFTKEEQLTLRWYRAAEQVLHSYDFLGLLLKSNCFQPQDINNIKNTWGESIKRCNSKLYRYLDAPFRPKDITLEQNLIEIINASASEGKNRAQVLQQLIHENQLQGLSYNNFKELVTKVSQ